MKNRLKLFGFCWLSIPAFILVALTMPIFSIAVLFMKQEKIEEILMNAE
jgi:hypothetical protein